MGDVTWVVVGHAHGDGVGRQRAVELREGVVRVVRRPRGLDALDADTLERARNIDDLAVHHTHHQTRAVAEFAREARQDGNLVARAHLEMVEVRAHPGARSATPRRWWSVVRASLKAFHASSRAEESARASRWERADCAKFFIEVGLESVVGALVDLGRASSVIDARTSNRDVASSPSRPRPVAAPRRARERPRR